MPPRLRRRPPPYPATLLCFVLSSFIILNHVTTAQYLHFSQYYIGLGPQQHGLQLGPQLRPGYQQQQSLGSIGALVPLEGSSQETFSEDSGVERRLPPRARSIDTQSYYNIHGITDKACQVGSEAGQCMFVWECIKQHGKHMGMCKNGFMFGSCCALTEAPSGHGEKEGLSLSHPDDDVIPVGGSAVQSLASHLQKDPQKESLFQRPPLILTPELSANSTVVNTFSPFKEPLSSTLSTGVIIPVTGVSASISLVSPSSHFSNLSHVPSTDHFVTASVTRVPIMPAPIRPAPIRPAPISPVHIIPGVTASQSGRFPTEALLTNQIPLIQSVSLSDDSTPGASDAESSTESHWVRPSNVIKPPIPPSRPTRPPKPSKPFKDRWWYYPTKTSKYTTPHTKNYKPLTGQTTTPSIVELKTTSERTTTTPTTTSSSTSTTSATTTHAATTQLMTSTSSPLDVDWVVEVTEQPSEPGTGPVASGSHTEDKKCGVAAMMPMPEARIVNGSTPAFGKWPWQVSVRRISFFGFTSTHRCGGALLNNRWVATAGHCVDDLLVSQIRVRVGEYDFSSVLETYPHLERAVIRKVVHPKYDFFTYEYDLALVKVEESIHFMPHISPICLPGNDDQLIGEMATVTGWGRLSEHGTLPSVLQEATVPIMSNEQCRNLFLKGGRKESIPDIFLCAGYEGGGRDSCQGDSGGPLQVKGKDGRYFLAGIISWGIGCAEANLPGVCTRISKFVPFILEAFA